MDSGGGAGVNGGVGAVASAASTISHICHPTRHRRLKKEGGYGYNPVEVAGGLDV